MFIALDDRRTRSTASVLVMLSINLIDSALIAHHSQRTIIAVAATLDVTLVVSALYYWLLVRLGIRVCRLSL